MKSNKKDKRSEVQEQNSLIKEENPQEIQQEIIQEIKQEIKQGKRQQNKKAQQKSNAVRVTKNTNEGFYQLPLIANYINMAKEDIIQKFKSHAKKMQPKSLHDLRQRILSAKSMQGKNSIESKLQKNAANRTYTYSDEYSAVFLPNICKSYHHLPLEYVADCMSQFGKFTCPDCDIQCLNTEDILLDALLSSYFHQVKNFPSSFIIFNRKEFGSVKKDQQLKQTQQSSDKTLIDNLSNPNGTFDIITLKVLQMSQDQKLQHLTKHIVIDKIEKAENANLSTNFEMQQLSGYNFPIMINLICFYSKSKIRNPLMHRLCKPESHKNKLVAYSFEHVYRDLFEPQNKNPDKELKLIDKIRCAFYPQCDNYFDKNNFQSMGLIIGNIKKEIYQETKYCLIGEYFGNFYHKDWHLSLFQENVLEAFLSKDKQRNKLNRYMPAIKEEVTLLTTPMNLQQSLKFQKKILKKFPKEKMSGNKLDNNEKIVIVSCGDFSICPTRCRWCRNLNSLDIYIMVSNITIAQQKKCPICNEEFTKINLVDNLYVDIELMKFLFFEGFAKEVLYNFQNSKYLHKIDYYSAASMRDKLKLENKVITGDIYKYAMNVSLPKGKKYIPFIDSRCKKSNKFIQSETNKHYIYLVENQKINSKLMCEICQESILSDQLEYNEMLEFILKTEKNELKWKEGEKSLGSSNIKAISSIKYYKDIDKKYTDKFNQNEIVLYWKNYQGGLIKHPFKFTKCAHEFSTTICDFSDILYQIKMENATKFQCRYQDCKIIYESIEEMQKIQLDLFKMIEEDKVLYSNLRKSNNFWLKYSQESNTIAIDLEAEKENLLEEIKYRSKYNFKSENFNQKEMEQRFNQYKEEFQELDLLIKQDQESFHYNQTYKNANNAQQFATNQQRLRQLTEIINSSQLEKQKIQVIKTNYKRIQNNAKTINFSKLQKWYPKKAKQLENTQIIQKRKEIEVDLENYKMQGNIFEFKMAVNKFVPLVDITIFKQAADKVNKGKTKE